MHCERNDYFTIVAAGINYNRVNHAHGEVVSPVVVDLDNDHFERYGHSQSDARIYVWHRVLGRPEFYGLPACWMIGV
jgi:hypothetical protein